MANAHGYNALFHNPAGFAGQEGAFTVLSSSAWVYANPCHSFQALGNSDPSTLISFVEDEITAGGFGFSEGIGYVGKGVGIGAVLNVDSYLWGPTTLGAVGRMDATRAFIGGLALPINLFGIKINLGADLSIFELNAAIFTREMGKHIGDRPNAGMNVEAAIRF